VLPLLLSVMVLAFEHARSKVQPSLSTFGAYISICTILCATAKIGGVLPSL
jgi:hypothetical protein